MIAAYTLGAIGAALGLAATVITVRSTRQLHAAQASVQQQTAGQIEDVRLAALRDEVDDERNKRRGLEAELDAERRKRETLERRVARLEAQVRSLGAEPANGS